MKVGVITVHNGQNYGASLQAFALVEKLRQMGYEAYLIDYRTSRIEERMKSYVKLSDWSSISGLKHSIRVLGSNILFHADRNYRLVKAKFDAFHDSVLEPSHQAFYQSSELYALNDRYDAFICGSDQIWNKDITDLDGGFFLDFAAKGKVTVAYAPSLGMPSDMIDQDTAEILRKKMAGVQHLSIREANNRELIEYLTHRACKVVVDPVLLLKKGDWQNLISRANDVCSGTSYAFYYPVVDQPELEAFAIKEAKQRGLKLMNPRLVPGYAKLKGFSAFPKATVGPLEFLKLLANAEVVFTNSFHATVFATVFGKELYTLRLKRKHVNRNNRLLEYLKMVGLLDSQAASDDCIHITASNADHLEEVLMKSAEESIQYLRDAL